VALCDAVVDAVNTAYAVAAPGDWPCSFNARRAFAQVADLDDIKAADDPLVLIIPHTDREEGPLDWSGEYEVMCVIYARAGIPGSDAAEAACAKFMALRDILRDSLRRVQLSVTGIRTFQAILSAVNVTDTLPAYGMDSLLQKHCFCGSQVLVFMVNA